MARYMGQVAVFRASVPVGKPLPPQIDFAVTNKVDELTQKKWIDLGLVPSAEPTITNSFVGFMSIFVVGCQARRGSVLHRINRSRKAKCSHRSLA